jgi:hypothetical protein
MNGFTSDDVLLPVQWLVHTVLQWDLCLYEACAAVVSKTCLLPWHGWSLTGLQ